VFSFFAFIPATQRLQDNVYGESHTKKGHYVLITVCILLFYISLSYISALDFNPFIYFRF
jgi:hypothetical protein